ICFAFAASTAVGNPVTAFALFNYSKPIVLLPSNSPGRVRGFQIPALQTDTFPVAANNCAGVNNCSSVSALQGPEIIQGSFLMSSQVFNGWMFNCSFIFLVFKLLFLFYEGCVY